MEVVVVSSGAIAEGMRRLGWTVAAPSSARAAGRLAAVGQMGLVQAYESRPSAPWPAPRRCCSPTTTWPTASAT